MENKQYTKEELEELADKMLKNPTNSEIEWKHYEWEDNGEKFSAWEFKSDRCNLYTGDGGKAEFDRIFKEEINKILTNE